MTITVGAVNEWDYAKLLRSVFSDNQIVADSLDNDANYRVVNNTYDDFTFELSGLYADNESLFIVVEIISATPAFNEPLTEWGGNLNSVYLLSESSGSEIAQVLSFNMSSFNFYVIDETRKVAVIHYTEPSWDEAFTDSSVNLLSNTFPFLKAVEEGREFTILFGDASYSGPCSQTFSGLPLKGGGAEVRFTIDALSMQEAIIMQPGLTLERNVVVEEIRITPFSYLVIFEENSEAPFMNAGNLDNSVVEDFGSIIMTNGDIKPLRMSRHGEYGQDEGILQFVTYGYTINYENFTWFATFRHDHLLDLDEVAAIVIKDVVIPILK
jgi:hypothetical protein